MASSSSTSGSQYCPRWKYDAFLSFRGADTRKTFTGHLYEGLKNRGIITFQDDKRLEGGDSISEELLKAIKESQVAIIIFSKKYATSRWCLNELVKIMECKEEENGQTVIPVFYDVDPSDVRYQRESFAEAFDEHESRYKDDVEGMEKVQAWRIALTAAANLTGYDIRDEIESEKVQQIVDYISSKFCKSARSLSFLQDIVGLTAHLEKLKSLLQIEINDVRVLGIWGIGGVGKTTIAKALFDTLSYQFKSACFLADVKENARKNELHSLQNTLLSDLLRKKDNNVNNKHDGKSMISSRLCSMKVLIVLDDIDHHDHLEYLAGDVGWFGNGSRVIVTTRNRHLIEKDDAIYKLPTLLDYEAMQLFNQHAFQKKVPDERFKELSFEVVDHAKGLPLALKVWGSLLHKKDLIQWRRTVDQIKKNSNSEIVEKLKISYDGLEPEEQKIFLDIACFFRGYERPEVMQILESCGFGAEYGLNVLIDKSLVFISENDRIEMHDLIEDMGKYVVKMQKDSRKPSRIWNVEDFEDVMVDNTGTIAVEAIWIRHYYGKLRFSKEAMKNMQRLRILCIRSYSEENDGPFEYLSSNLCWCVWHDYPWKLLPQNFNPTRLVHLQLQQSSLHHLWNETKELKSLRGLDLSWSEGLKSTPDFQGMPNLEYLDLRFCKSLKEVHPSLRYSRKLIRLTLIECTSLERFPHVNVESLEYLSLRYCSSLEKFPEICGSMKPELKISMSYSGLREIPSSIIRLRVADLTKLDLSSMKSLESLPEEIGDLENLEELDASYTLISRPPSSIVRLNKLKVLNFAKHESEGRSVHFVFPPLNEGLLSLEQLNLSYCNLTDGALPEDIGSLSSLKKLDLRGNNFEHLPQSIAQLGALESLDLSGCKKLKELPEFTGMPNLEYLDLDFCKSLEEVHHSLRYSRKLIRLILIECKSLERFPYVNVESLESLFLDYCSRLEKFPEICGSMKPELMISMSYSGLREIPSSIIHLLVADLTKLDLSSMKSLESLPEEIGDLENLEELHARNTLISRPPSSLVRLNKLKFLTFAKYESEDRSVYFVFPLVNKGLRSLEDLDLRFCNLTDRGLPEDIGSLSSLKTLYIMGNNFEHLPRSIAQLGALQSLYLSFCKKLKELPCFTGMPNLDTLDLSECNLIDGAFPEGIGSLSSLKKLDLRGNNFEHLPQSIAQLGALESLDLSNCKKLKELPCFTGMPNLEYLDLNFCKSLKEVHPSLGYSKKLIRLTLIECTSLERFPHVNVESLESLILCHCSSLEKFPEIHGKMKPELKITLKSYGLREIPSSIIHLLVADLTKLDLSSMKSLESLPEEIGDLENLEELDASYTLISRPPSSIVRLNKLKVLNFAKHESEGRSVHFVFPPLNEGLLSLEQLNLSYCNLTDGALPEDIGSLSSLKKLNLRGNNFEHLHQSITQLGALESLDLSNCKKLKELSCFMGMPNLDSLDLSECNLTDGALPEDIGSLSSLKKLNLRGNNFEHLRRSIAQLGALESLDLSNCKKLKELPCFTGMPNLDSLDLSECNLTDGALPEDIGSLSSLKKLNLRGNNFEHLRRSITQLGALESLDLSNCKKLTQLPKFPQHLYKMNAEWSSDSICNSLFRNISSLQHDISDSGSFSLRVFTSWRWDGNIPSWFHHKGIRERVSVNLCENWYASDKFLGFAVCYSGMSIDEITAHLIPLCDDDGMSSMTQKFALSKHPRLGIHFFVVPLAGLWDASKANGKTPNDYGCFRLFSTGHMNYIYGVRLLYKDEPELHRYDEACCCFPLLQLFFPQGWDYTS